MIFPNQGTFGLPSAITWAPSGLAGWIDWLTEIAPFPGPLHCGCPWSHVSTFAASPVMSLASHMPVTCGSRFAGWTHLIRSLMSIAQTQLGWPPNALNHPSVQMASFWRLDRELFTAIWQWRIVVQNLCDNAANFFCMQLLSVQATPPPLPGHPGIFSDPVCVPWCNRCQLHGLPLPQCWQRVPASWLETLWLYFGDAFTLWLYDACPAIQRWLHPRPTEGPQEDPRSSTGDTVIHPEALYTK